jgi:Domain of unknown function (DUF5076)
MTFMVAFNPYDTLPVADEALDRGGVELLRAGLASEELFITVRRAFETPDRWGGVLANITLHLAALYSADGDLTKDNVVAIVAQTFAQSLRHVVTPSSSAAKGTGRTKPAKASAKKAKVETKKPARSKAKTPVRAKAKTKPASTAIAGRKSARGKF